MRKLFVFAVFILTISGCKNLVPYTDAMKNKYSWSEEQIKSIRFYLSHDVVLHRELANGSTDIANGKIKSVHSSKVEEIIIPAGTKGAVIEIPNEKKLLVSFEVSDDRYLSFGVNTLASDKYVLLASDWKDEMGKVHYAGNEYYTDPGSKYASLLVDLHKIEKMEVRQRVAKGRTPDREDQKIVTSSYTQKNDPKPNYTPQTTKTEITTVKKEIPRTFPILTVTDGKVAFKDENKNGRIDANETASISFEIQNTGKGRATSLKAMLHEENNLSGIFYERTIMMGDLDAGGKKTYTIPISSSINIPTGIASFSINFEEAYGFPPDKVSLEIPTVEFKKPRIVIADNQFYSENGKLQKGYPIQFKFLVQNIGQGSAQNVNANCQLPTENIFATGEVNFNLGNLSAGESKELVVDFVANKKYVSDEIPVTIILSEKYGKFSETLKTSAKLNAVVASPKVILQPQNIQDPEIEIKTASLTSDVDKDIPTNNIQRKNTFVLAIGNENYKTEINVDYASNDAEIFKKYAERCLGVPSQNIHYIKNGSFGEMLREIDWLSEVGKAYGKDAKLIFYYAGHGMPDESSKSSYLLPIDGSASLSNTAISLQTIYNKLSTGQTETVTVLLDACFSGSARNGMLASGRGVIIKPKEERIPENMIVMSAVSGDQTAYPYKEKEHGLFTYFLLQKLKESKGKITYGKLSDQIISEVVKQSIVTNNKVQNPEVKAGTNLETDWRDKQF